MNGLKMNDSQIFNINRDSSYLVKDKDVLYNNQGGPIPHNLARALIGPPTL